MGTLTKNIADDYSVGVIEFTCQDDVDIRHIGGIIQALGFEMQFKKLTGVKMDNKTHLENIFQSLQSLQKHAKLLRDAYPDDRQGMPGCIDFLTTQILDMTTPVLQVQECFRNNVEPFCKDCLLRLMRESK